MTTFLSLFIAALIALGFQMFFNAIPQMRSAKTGDRVRQDALLGLIGGDLMLQHRLAKLLSTASPRLSDQASSAYRLPGGQSFAMHRGKDIYFFLEGVGGMPGRLRIYFDGKLAGEYDGDTRALRLEHDTPEIRERLYEGLLEMNIRENRLNGLAPRRAPTNLRPGTSFLRLA